MPVEDSRECVLCFWQLEDLCNALLILPSSHTFQFPEHPQDVSSLQMETLSSTGSWGPWPLSTGKETTSPDSSWCQV